MRSLAFGLTLIVAVSSALAGTEPIPVRRVSLDLPGAPSILVPVDLNHDGRKDLFVALVYTEFEELAFERTEAFVQFTSIVPALFERREARAYLSAADGTLSLAGPPLPLPASVLTIAAGPPAMPLLALTDDGVAAIRLDERGTLKIEPVLADPPVFRGAGTLLPGLRFMADLDGEGGVDLLIPARDGVAAYLSNASGFEAAAASRSRLAGDSAGFKQTPWRTYPIPGIEDLDADGKPELILTGADDTIRIMKGAGGGRFLPATEIRVSCMAPPDTPDTHPEFVFLGDVDGSGRAELVTRVEIHPKGEGDMDEAKRPHALYRFHHLKQDLSPEDRPYHEIEAVGHAFGEGFSSHRGSALADLDGDGRLDLVTAALDFSMLQVVRVLATKKIGVGLEFQVYAQGDDGRFLAAPTSGLTEKILLDLNDLKLGRLINFTADFDGDGVIDFSHLERGREILVHRGAKGCRFPARPDRVLKLQDAPDDPALIRVMDLDADGRSDLVVTRPSAPAEPGASAAVHLDLYFSEARP